jgi:hypothetical protein
MIFYVWNHYPETRLLIGTIAGCCVALQVHAWWVLVPRTSVRRRQLEIRTAGLDARGQL